MGHRPPRRGFTLLEVMISVSILALALIVLIQTQGMAALMTEEADHILVATQLANEKLTEVRVLVEQEGFQTSDVHEEGDFDDFGDEALNIEFEALDDYHWEYLVTEVDLDLAGDLAGSMNNLMDTVAPPGAPEGSAAAAGAAIPDLGAYGISEDTLIQMLQPFLREVRVRVWWGDDLEEAEEIGNEVVITTHVINPRPSIIPQGQPPGTK